MRKFGFLVAILALSIGFTACDRTGDDPKPPVDEIVEDGFYVVGEATANEKLDVKGTMVPGINEVEQTTRDGMYEKYIALEGGKSFSLVLKQGVKETVYGATLTDVDLAGENEQPDMVIKKGKLTEGGKLQVSESGLYHIVLDLNLNSDLDEAQILIAPAKWGIRGAMNGWGFTEMEASAFNKETMTFSLKDVEIKAGQKFKLAYGGGWKIELDNDELVKANTNLGEDMVPGGEDLDLFEEHGVYDLTLTWTLTDGDVASGYELKTQKTADLEVEEPTSVFMIGEEFGDWNWESDGVVEFAPVHSAEDHFWAIRYISAGKGFKWSQVRAWDGDFAGLENNEGFTIDGGNAFVADDGIYMIYINLEDSSITIEPAKVYGIGDAFGGWDGEVEANLFVPTDDGLKLTQTTKAAAAELRFYAASSVQSTDWWTREFIILDGKIEYRGDGDDQERVAVTAGQKITLDFNAGTGTIE